MISMSWSNAPKQLQHVIKTFIVLMTFVSLSNHSGNDQTVKSLQGQNVGSNITIEITSQQNVEDESVYAKVENGEVESSTLSLQNDVRHTVLSSVNVRIGIEDGPSSVVQTKTPSTKTSENKSEGVKIIGLEDTVVDEPTELISSVPSSFQGLEAFQETLQRLRKRGQDFAIQAIKQALPTLIRLNSEIRISSSCSGSLLKLAIGIRKIEEWAIKMLDSCGKIPAGILHGTLGELGDYEQCQDIVVYRQRGNHEERFRGQYCSINIKPYLPAGVEYHVYTSNKTVHELEEMYAIMSRGSLRLGICLPSSCSMDDVKQMVNQARKRVELNVTVSSCEVKDSVWHFDNSQLAVFSFNASVLAIVLVGTVIELSRRCVQRRRNGNAKDRAETCLAIQVIESFSAYGNTQYQLSTHVENNHLRVVDGLRVITMTWIILGEIYQSMETNQTGALRKIFNLREDFAFQMVIQFPFALDTLFFTRRERLEERLLDITAHFLGYFFANNAPTAEKASMFAESEIRTRGSQLVSQTP
ncbi:uncharacterized protein LOC143222903 isoform X2 [Tachypleus tridentatus]|uniref:uncharacterized protein LOC143222903 isoform X2 n=1 Tax=Tachypleus tridentatus TaxID=6853 RepID=UPI003FD44DA1